MPNPHVSTVPFRPFARVTTERRERRVVEIIQKDRTNVDFVILFGLKPVYKRARHRSLRGSKERMKITRIEVPSRVEETPGDSLDSSLRNPSSGKDYSEDETGIGGNLSEKISFDLATKPGSIDHATFEIFGSLEMLRVTKRNVFQL